MAKNALVLTSEDNVATALEEISAGDTVDIYTSAGEQLDQLTVSGDIPRGHKIALCDIAKGESILKYGYQIGLASLEIKRGDYVHVHNLESARGRGDL